MPKLIFRCLCLCLPLLLPLPAGAQSGLLPLDDEDSLQWLGMQIYRNECNAQAACLTSWNQGEDFPSLGIGHFIWFQAGQSEPFEESFPGLLHFLQEQGANLPDWIEAGGFAQPWATRAAFLAAQEGPELTALRTLLQSTLALQTRYILQRHNSSMARMLGALPEGQAQAIARRIESMLTQDPRRATYALVDYVHFKGEGSNPQERYQGTGWGLLQVLETMPLQPADPLQDFVSSAAQVLHRRVTLAPPERNEARWLAGWQKRLDSYLQPLDP